MKIDIFSREIEGMPKNQVETFELIDTITELECLLEDLKNRMKVRKKKRANELEGQSTKIIQSGEHRRKKKSDKKWTDSQRPVGQYHKFLYTMIIVLEEEEKEICAQTYLKKSCLKIFQIW